MSKKMKVNECPQCGRESDDIKMHQVHSIVFLLFFIYTNRSYIKGCPKCNRKQLLKHLLISIVPTNVLWPIATLPEFIYYWVKSRKPGHSPLWLELVESVNGMYGEPAAADTPDAPPKEELPEIDLYQRCTHQPGTVFDGRGGEFGTRSVLVLLLWSLLAVPPLGYVYALATYETTELGVRVILAVALLLAQAWIFYKLAMLSACRSMDGLRIAALLNGLWFLYCSWACWMYLVSNREFFIFDPVKIWRALVYLGREGMWGDETQTFSTLEHYFAWACEAALFLLAPLIMVWKAVRKIPFCSLCMEKLQPFHRLRQRNAPDDQGPLKKSLLAGDLSGLTALPERSTPYYLDTEILYCPHCRGNFLIKVTYCVDMLDNDAVNTSTYPVTPLIHAAPADIAGLAR